MDKARTVGMEAYAAELDEKIAILEMLLNTYDDGRCKSFFCTAVNLLVLEDINAVIHELEVSTHSDIQRKDAAAMARRLFEEMAMKRDISLKLRKK